MPPPSVHAPRAILRPSNCASSRPRGQRTGAGAREPGRRPTSRSQQQGDRIQEVTCGSEGDGSREEPHNGDGRGRQLARHCAKAMPLTPARQQEARAQEVNPVVRRGAGAGSLHPAQQAQNGISPASRTSDGRKRALRPAVVAYPQSPDQNDRDLADPEDGFVIVQAE
jgi:hypothetical protein